MFNVLGQANLVVRSQTGTNAVHHNDSGRDEVEELRAENSEVRGLGDIRRALKAVEAGWHHLIILWTKNHTLQYPNL